MFITRKALFGTNHAYYFDMNAFSVSPGPTHIGIIMDGNGRWAQKRCLPRSFGHQQGLQTVKRIVAAVRHAGIPFVSLYTFSTENWKRDRNEVDFLMNLIVSHLRNEFDFYRENQIRVVHSGRLAGLPEAVIQELEQVSRDTSGFSDLTVNLAINYGGRDEILRGVHSLVDTLLSEGGSIEKLRSSLESLGETDFSKWLDTPEIPDLDLILRTGGERRISNFLLWKSAYAELFFSDKLWPDFDEQDLFSILKDYATRERRFGSAPVAQAV